MDDGLAIKQYVDALKSDKERYTQLKKKLDPLFITPSDIYAVRKQVSIDPATLLERIDEVVACVLRVQTHNDIAKCKLFLSRWGVEDLPCTACSRSHVTQCTLAPGNPIIYVPIDLFDQVQAKFNDVVNDVRSSFRCPCHGGVGWKECSVQCTIDGISRVHSVRLRRWVPEMLEYCNPEIDSEFYLVKPYIEIIDSGPDVSPGIVAFRIHVYTWTQAAGIHYRIRAILSQLECTYSRYKVVTHEVPEYNLRQRIYDHRTNFHRVLDPLTGELTPHAGCIPAGAIVVGPRVARMMVGKDHATISKIRKKLGIPSLNVMVIPCNIHGVNCITSREFIDAKKRSLILAEIETFSRIVFRPVGDRW